MEHHIVVTLPGGRTATVPWRNPTPWDPSAATIGPLPPEVAECYEVRIFPVRFLVRRQEPDADAPTVVGGGR